MTKLFKNLVMASALVFIAACAAPTPPGVGVQPSVWTISADGTGMMSGEQGDQDLEGIMLEGNTISFDVEIDAGGQSLSLSFSGTVDGDSLSGEFDSDFGAFGVTGTRQ